MNITILTLFPAMFDGFRENSIIKRAIAKNAVTINVVNIRPYSLEKTGRTDSEPIGGGAGLVQKAQPIVYALDEHRKPNSHVVLLSPRGKPFNQKKAVEFSKMEDIVFVCGHYEGVDERVNNFVDELVSIGDYVLTGGEIPAMAISDSVIRLLDGVIASESLVDESFNDNLLEYPQFTEPYDFRGFTVPEILYSGNSKIVQKWRRRASLLLTREYREDLFEKVELSEEDKIMLEEYDNGETPQWEIRNTQVGKTFIKAKKKRVD